jgi:1-acyl-sn-glycerol-3-phosphate acyltransferase
MGLLDMVKEMAREVTDPAGIDDLLQRFPTKVGSYGFDPWGFNIKGVRATIGFGKFFYENYFRVEANGLENIPKDGRLLIIGNHSGQLPIDGFLLGYTLLTNPHAPRACKSMMERFVPTVPFISSLFAEVGGAVGDPINASRMLESEEAIIVFPEGSRGISKPFRKRYQLQKFGTGFMHLAVNHDTPIIPVGIVGCEESIISLGNPHSLARRLKLPSAPILLPMVFPTKVIINIGEPMFFEKAVDREDLMEDYVRDVKQEINRLINMGLKKRKNIFGL